MPAVSDSSITLLQVLRHGLHGGVSCIWRRAIRAEGIQLMDGNASQPSDGDECSFRQPRWHKLPAGMYGTYVIPVTAALVYKLILTSMIESVVGAVPTFWIQEQGGVVINLQDMT
jgi:hypothetical protein